MADMRICLYDRLLQQPNGGSKSGEDDQEALEYLQAFANIQEQAKFKSSNTELESLGDTKFENSEEDNAKVEVHNE